MRTSTTMPTQTTRTRTVEVTWVPVADSTGHVAMEMRWHVEDRPAVVRSAA